MKNRSAIFFANDLQAVLDDLVKDKIEKYGITLLRVVIPKELRGRTSAFVSYLRSTEYKFTFRIDNYANSEVKYLSVHSYQDGLLYFSFTNKSDFIIKPPSQTNFVTIID